MRLGRGDDASSPTRRRPDLDRTPSQMSFLPPTCEGSALFCWTSQGFSSEGREVDEDVFYVRLLHQASSLQQRTPRAMRSTVLQLAEGVVEKRMTEQNDIESVTRAIRRVGGREKGEDKWLKDASMVDRTVRGCGLRTTRTLEEAFVVGQR